jgi:hypothetical protein
MGIGCSGRWHEVSRKRAPGSPPTVADLMRAAAGDRLTVAGGRGDEQRKAPGSEDEGPRAA